MKPIALRLRLFAASTASIVIALLIAGVSIAALFANHVEKNLTEDLTAQFDRLVALVDPLSSPLSLSAPLADPSFARPYGGLYWQITDPATKERIRSRSMWDYEFTLDDPKLLDGTFHNTRMPDPEGTIAITLVQRLRFDMDDGSSRTLDVIVAEDLIHFYIANAKFRSDLALSLLLLALVLAIAAWVQITLGLSPLSAIKREVNSIRGGGAKRMGEAHPPEVMPLVSEVNELLDNQDRSIAFARTRAANLAHGLKTALTILGSEVENIRKTGYVESAKIIEDTTNDMSAIIDHQLRLSRLKSRSNADHYSTPLHHHIENVVKTLKRTPEGENVVWHIGINDSIAVNLDAPDLLELLGIIIENAARWTKRNIYINADLVEQGVCLIIEDDGPGVSLKQIELLGKRGLRLDSKGSGNGIGLSIASEIVAMNSGQLHFSRSRKGGLKVKIILPVAYDGSRIG